MQGFEYIQSLLDAHRQESYDLNKAHGDEIVEDVNIPKQVARVSLDARYAQSWVVTLGPATTPGQQGIEAGGNVVGINPQVLLDAACIVEWGMGASSNWAIVDWNKGQQFSVWGSFVKIHGIVNAFGTAALPPDPAVRFSGHIAPGRCANAPLRTINYGTVLAAADSELAVPPFARVVGLRAATAVGGIPDGSNILIRGRSVAGGTILWVRRWNIAGDGRIGAPDLGLTLPVLTNTMSIFNSTATNIVAQLVYELSL